MDPQSQRNDDEYYGRKELCIYIADLVQELFPFPRPSPTSSHHSPQLHSRSQQTSPLSSSSTPPVAPHQARKRTLWPKQAHPTPPVPAVHFISASESQPSSPSAGRRSKEGGRQSLDSASSDPPIPTRNSSYGAVAGARVSGGEDSSSTTTSTSGRQSTGTEITDPSSGSSNSHHRNRAKQLHAHIHHTHHRGQDQDHHRSQNNPDLITPGSPSPSFFSITSACSSATCVHAMDDQMERQVAELERQLEVATLDIEGSSVRTALEPVRDDDGGDGDDEGHRNDSFLDLDEMSPELWIEGDVEPTSIEHPAEMDNNDAESILEKMEDGGISVPDLGRWLAYILFRTDLSRPLIFFALHLLRRLSETYDENDPKLYNRPKKPFPLLSPKHPLYQHSNLLQAMHLATIYLWDDCYTPHSWSIASAGVCGTTREVVQAEMESLSSLSYEILLRGPKADGFVQFDPEVDRKGEEENMEEILKWEENEMEGWEKRKLEREERAREELKRVERELQLEEEERKKKQKKGKKANRRSTTPGGFIVDKFNSSSKTPMFNRTKSTDSSRSEKNCYICPKMRARALARKLGAIKNALHPPQTATNPGVTPLSRTTSAPETRFENEKTHSETSPEKEGEETGHPEVPIITTTPLEEEFDPRSQPEAASQPPPKPRGRGRSRSRCRVCNSNKPWRGIMTTVPLPPSPPHTGSSSSDINGKPSRPRSSSGGGGGGSQWPPVFNRLSVPNLDPSKHVVWANMICPPCPRPKPMKMASSDSSSTSESSEETGGGGTRGNRGCDETKRRSFRCFIPDQLGRECLWELPTGCNSETTKREEDKEKDREKEENRGKPKVQMVKRIPISKAKGRVIRKHIKSTIAQSVKNHH